MDEQKLSGDKERDPILNNNNHEESGKFKDFVYRHWFTLGSSVLSGTLAGYAINGVVKGEVPMMIFGSAGAVTSGTLAVSSFIEGRRELQTTSEESLRNTDNPSDENS